MVAKRPQRGSFGFGEQAPAPEPMLRPSDTPGVYLNALNVPVDANGVAMTFQDVAQHDEAHWRSALDSTKLTPGEFLRAVVANPRMPLALRIDVAKSVVPYTDRKQPVSVDGGTGADGQPKPLFSPDALANTSTKDLIAIRDALRKLGSPI